jgi:hypothetical protein
MKGFQMLSAVRPMSLCRVVASGILLGLVIAFTVDIEGAHAQRKTISLDEIVIEGTIQKPEAFFILPRSSLNFEELNRKADMKARILKSVEKDPF